MYEMYPDAWRLTERHPAEPVPEPRRRARRTHSVLPPVLTEPTRGSTVAAPSDRR